MSDSTSERLKPSPGGWRVEGVSAAWTAWRSPCGKLRALVSVDFADGVHQHHISVTKRPSLREGPQGAMPRRANSLECRYVLGAFGAIDFEEDNHTPNAAARNFWHRIDAPQTPCACKDEEPAHIDPDDGYEWR